MGRTRGLILGVAVTSNRYNSSLCEFIHKERDTDGFCIIGKSEYRVYLDCGYEKFKIKGNKTLGALGKLGLIPQRIIYYPIMGC